MKRKFIRVLSVLCTLVVLACVFAPTAGAASFTNSVATKSESILLVNTDTGQTVYEKEADTKRYPASTTKIMTYIVVIENVDDIENTRVTIKKDVLDKLKGTGSSVANLEAHIGKTMSVKDLLYSMMDRPFMVCRITMRIHQWWISRESKGETAICISAGLIRKKKQLLWISRWSRNGLWQILRYERMPVRWHYREDPLYIVWKKKIMVQICICFR